MISALAISPSLDVTYVVDDLDGIQRPVSTHRVPGGKALNAARAATVLGARVAVVAVLGAGIGEDVAAGARRVGVDLRVVPDETPTRSCISILSRRSERLTEIYEHAVPVTPGVAYAAVDAAVGLAVERPGWAFASGGLPASAPVDLLGDLVRRWRAVGARVAVDSHGSALRSAVRARPDLVKVNRDEAVELTGRAARTPVPELLTAVRALTGGLVVVTDGAAGAWATDGQRLLRAGLSGRKGSFPVGSGDSFLGGLLVALDRGDDLAGALALGTAAGTANAQAPGAAVLDPDLVRRLTPEVELHEERLPAAAQSATT